jgi:uncharacterized RmlC-like cupin family protein
MDPEVRIIRSGDALASKQGLMSSGGVSAETCAAQGLWMGLITIPPGGRANAHLHEQHETALYVIEGEAEMWYGDQLEQYVRCQAGDFLYIPAGVPHVAANASQTHRCVAVGARTDPSEQESVVLRPDLETNG